MSVAKWRVVILRPRQVALGGAGAEKFTEQVGGYCRLYELEVTGERTCGAGDPLGVLEEIKKTGADGVVVAMADWAVDVSEVCRLAVQVHELGLHLFDTSSSTSTTDATGRMFLGVLVAVGKWEKEARGMPMTVGKGWPPMRRRPKR